MLYKNILFIKLMNKILENMYSVDNSVYILLKKHENINIIIIKSNNIILPECISYYNKLRYEETNKIDLLPKDKWDLVKKEIRYYEN